MTKTTLTALTITAILALAPIASGSFGGIILTADAVPQQACPEGTILDPSTKQCGTEPTCTAGYYNPATNQCEEEITVSATCTSGTLNTATDLCESTITTDPSCNSLINAFFSPALNACVILRCFPPFGGCTIIPVGAPSCSLGTYNQTSKLCEATATTAPICSVGSYNTATNVCDAISSTAANCSIGLLNPSTDLCEISPVHGKIPLCHIAGKNGKTVEISVNIEALEGHLIHGDTVGTCE